MCFNGQHIYSRQGSGCMYPNVQEVQKTSREYKLMEMTYGNEIRKVVDDVNPLNYGAWTESENRNSLVFPESEPEAPSDPEAFQNNLTAEWVRPRYAVTADELSRFRWCQYPYAPIPTGRDPPMEQQRKFHWRRGEYRRDWAVPNGGENRSTVMKLNWYRPRCSSCMRSNVDFCTNTSCVLPASQGYPICHHFNNSNGCRAEDCPFKHVYQIETPQGRFRTRSSAKESGVPHWTKREPRTVCFDYLDRSRTPHTCLAGLLPLLLPSRCLRLGYL